MERFEFEDGRTLDIFSGFVGKTKLIFATLIENIKINIKGYEARIEDTTKEIAENEMSREKCIHEISKMEGKISDIKEAIENVENTYKKIADAYSSTSKGDTKELYSEIIDGAKANCEKDVEKNRSEIARLNSDIEAIKNNISEFTKIIDELNRDLENYNLELYKYNKALEYMDRTADKSNEDLEEISSKKEILKKAEVKTTKKTSTAKSAKSEEKTTSTRTSRDTSKTSVFSTIDNETFKTSSTKSSAKTVSTKSEDSYDATLKQIYDLTGYKPSGFDKPSEPKVEKAEVEEKKVYTDNLESLFSAPVSEPKPVESNPFLDSSFSNWEDILNTPSTSTKDDTNNKIEDNMEATANQLLAPYGTDYRKLVGLVGKEIAHKDGSRVPFGITADDVIKAVNSIDGNDLKKMKTVGPEVTLIRKIKGMKEGNL
ncbi:MAG TPA: hypothetical protein DCY94_02070 [Firmicutes bacterium]|nr:hypothetical protein [Bacillota bacterium]